MFSDPKTSIVGVITGILGLLAAFGVVVPDWLSKGETIALIGTVGASVIGILAKDGKKE